MYIIVIVETKPEHALLAIFILKNYRTKKVNAMFWKCNKMPKSRVRNIVNIIFSFNIVS